MKAKFLIVCLAVSVLICSVFTSGLYAKDCGKSKGDISMEGKFSKKIMLIFKNKDSIGLSDEQMIKIKDLKIAIKKDIIRAQAEIDIVAVDMKSQMYNNDVDLDALNKLIDKKYDLKKAKAKLIVGACSALRGILTKEQKEKMKEFMKGRMKEHHMKGPMMKGKKGR
ncbi:Spy/CpxP family protein refolding chaperone [Thermoproteota archaeon]